MEGRGRSFPIIRLTFQVRTVIGGGGGVVILEFCLLNKNSKLLHWACMNKTRTPDFVVVYIKLVRK